MGLKIETLHDLTLEYQLSSTDMQTFFEAKSFLRKHIHDELRLQEGAAQAERE